MSELAKRLHTTALILSAATSLRDGGHAEFRNDVGNRRSTGCHRAGAWYASQTPISHAVALIEVECGKGNLFELKIFPDIQLRPIQEGMDTDMGAGWERRIELVLELRRLIPKIPFAMLIAQ